jgi:hypothetical protein
MSFIPGNLQLENERVQLRKLNIEDLATASTFCY